MDDQAAATDAGLSLVAPLALADWRRRMADLYAEVRRLSAEDPEAAWRHWVEVREALFRAHPSSPVPAADRSMFRARHWPYDPRLRFEAVALDPSSAGPPGGSTGSRGARAGPPGEAAQGAAAPLGLPSSGRTVPLIRRIGTVELHLAAVVVALTVYWLDEYSGGLFLPFGDKTNGRETYGAGRYLLDGAKSADLGGDAEAGTVVLDLNFAYHPSCAFDPRWSCPLAPPENRLPLAIRAGERLG
jgi:uncharacterized protein (DUF1684 family)